ncbi:MAG: tRNA (adenosine(37)-N6)-threonylcarbamoyltransferase complex ATPase subunit type 1 TsaE [Chthoniobacterales bacterium]
MLISSSPEDTAHSGAECARNARVGDVFALSGDLGAGKTQWTKGFVAAIGSNAAVTSPTFTLIHEYTGGRCPVYHFDFYRLEQPEAVLALGFDEYVESDGICIIEWADRFPQLLPPHVTTVAITAITAQGPEARTIEVQRR